MSWLQIVVLAIVQGLTEFLPISSSGHLVLVPSVLGWSDQGLAFDVAVHFGSLIAVCAYFRNDIAELVRGACQLVGFKNETRESQLALVLGIGTIPAAAAGLLLADWVESSLRDPTVTVVTLAGYGIVMLLADRFGRRDRDIAGVRFSDAIWIGCAQALALIPGTSRSGITISAARALGFKRQDAARFSFLLSVPVILLRPVVCAYFRNDIAELVRGACQLVGFKNETRESQLALVLGIGTIPAAAAGLLLADWVESSLRDPTVTVVTLAGYGIVMLLADRFGRRDRDIAGVRFSDAIWIGCAQALALIPGTSRSGITISAARALGFKRQDAARFSFLLSVPVILLASLYKGFEMLMGPTPVPWAELAVAALISAIVAYLSIGFFMRVVSRIGLLPFAVYRLLVAGVILYVLV